MATATVLGFLGGLTGLLTGLLVWISISARTEPEATASLATGFVALPLGAATCLLTETAAVIFGLCGAGRRAGALGLATMLGIVVGCVWLAVLM